MAEEDTQDTSATQEAESANESSNSYAAELQAEIEVNMSDAGVLRKALTVTVPAERVRQERDKQFGELLEDAVIPGFRRGRAPRVLLEKRFGGEVGDQVLTKLVSNAYMAAVEKEKLQTIGEPSFRVTVKGRSRERDKDRAAGAERASGAETAAEAPSGEKLLDITDALEHMSLPTDGPLTFTCEIEVKPEFELPALEGIPVERPVITITDEDVGKQIDRMRAMSGEFAPVAEGGVEPDDLVVADLTIRIGDEVVHAAENATFAARPQRIQGVVLSDLGEKLKGAQPGQAVSLTASVPDEHEQEAWRGKSAAFEFKVQDIKRLKLPPLDAAYLDSQGFDDEAEFRLHVRNRMESRLGEEVREGMANQVRRYLLEHTKLDLPAGLSARQVDRAIIRRTMELLRSGVPEAEIQKHADELRTSAREQTMIELKLWFILEKIAEKFETNVTEEEINSQIAAMAQRYGKRFDRMRDELTRGGGLESVYFQLRDEKCIDKILESARITDLSGPEKSGPGMADAT